LIFDRSVDPVAFVLISIALATAFPFKAIPRTAVAAVRRSAFIQSLIGLLVVVAGILVLGGVAQK
jgi:hypothetical protein